MAKNDLILLLLAGAAAWLYLKQQPTTDASQGAGGGNPSSTPPASQFYLPWDNTGSGFFNPNQQGGSTTSAPQAPLPPSQKSQGGGSVNYGAANISTPSGPAIAPVPGWLVSSPYRPSAPSPKLYVPNAPVAPKVYFSSPVVPKQPSGSYSGPLHIVR